MQRNTIDPRLFWQRTVKHQGLTFHSPKGVPYWNEAAYYSFTADEIDRIEAATNELHRLCLLAAEHVIERRRYAELGIPASAVKMIEDSWHNETPSLYGRFDLSYSGDDAPKMLEYNADTPTSLLEAAVVQWHWLEERFKGKDQFNSIHDRLVDKWRDLRRHLKPGPVHFAHMDDEEDFMTIVYLMDTAVQAGLEVQSITVDQIGWDAAGRRFVDQTDAPIGNVFKLYPWEWMAGEQFAGNIDALREFWIEPPWKMILSNKGILAILWEMFPGHENLLEAHIGSPRGMQHYARKPLLSREGANVSLLSNVLNRSPEVIEQTPGEYGEGVHVYQEFCPLPGFDGNHPVIGSWVIDGEAAGIGIRESDGMITGNTSRFVPHLFA